MPFDPFSSLGKLEAMLFIYGEPIELKKLAKITGTKESDLPTALDAFERELERGERGLALIRDRHKVQLVTKPAFAKILADITKQEFSESLTPAALETLSIISYAGPISRADVEYIRGVNSSFIVRTLLMRGLVEREVDPKRSNTYLYHTSFELLRHLGLQKNADLPDYAKYKELVAHMHEELLEKDAAQQNPVLPPVDSMSSLQADVTAGGSAPLPIPDAKPDPRPSRENESSHDYEAG